MFSRVRSHDKSAGSKSYGKAPEREICVSNRQVQKGSGEQEDAPLQLDDARRIIVLPESRRLGAGGIVIQGWLTSTRAEVVRVKQMSGQNNITNDPQEDRWK